MISFFLIFLMYDSEYPILRVKLIGATFLVIAPSSSFDHIIYLRVASQVAARDALF
jgi:hypothetical protein